jgi:3-oxoacyl-[acyl-carrier protein] reductase
MARRAVVSGGGTGIGKAVAARLAADGCAVVILGRRAEVLEKTVAELNAGLPRPLVSARTADLTEPDEVGALAARLTAEGPVDVLVNNAGGAFGSSGGTYGGAKAALHAWALGLATSLAADGVTVNVVAPGFVPDTEFWTGRLTDELVADRVSQIPAGRPGTPGEVAAAGWTTGQILQVNGGTLAGRG